MRFKLKHFKNLLIRIFTRDTYYVCEECHKVHKRDGKEIRLENTPGIRSYYLWYSSVSEQCYIDSMQKLRNLMRERLLGVKD